MNITCSPSGIINPFHPTQGVMDLVTSGFAQISLKLNMCCSSYELEHFEEPKLKFDPEEEKRKNEREFAPISEKPSEIKNFFRKMIRQCQVADIQIPIAFASCLPKDTKRSDPALLNRLVEINVETIKYCGSLGCRDIVICPLPLGADEGKKWQVNRTFFLSFADVARKNCVRILLQNQYQNKNGGIIRGVCSEGKTTTRWIDELNKEVGEELFGFCMDTGTCTLCGQNMQEFVSALGSRLKAVILRDCDGYRETSMLPFTYSGFERSGTDWLGLIRGLREIHFDGQLILDFATTAAAFSPLLRPQLMQLAKGVGEYFKWQIGIENVLKNHGSIVLFGAGNMCRNYMKCYGDKYPPLFTCDNNPKLWGTLFCGLEVKPPESLKKLPEDCTIVICNIYYRQIQKQLQDMGVKSEIEFFSDEFMPSFYFDRLERGE